MNLPPSARFLTPTSFAAAWLAVAIAAGCNDDSQLVRDIQAKRQIALQQSSQQDHLGEAVSLLQQYVELNEEKAAQQVSYHLNQWAKSGPAGDGESPDAVPKMVDTLTGILPREVIDEELSRDEFRPADVRLLRDSYLFRRVIGWVDGPVRDDPLWDAWLTGQTETMGSEPAGRLRVAARLFDWVVRNIALEPEVAAPAQVPSPQLPLGMVFEGPGYRQSTYQTLWRGRGDWLQRAGLFTELCLQAGIPSTLLATQDETTGQLRPWCVGVLIGEDLYLFETRLGVPVPGPDQVGIATLTQARRDASVMRRLNVAGYFEYPISRTDIQQNVALVNLRPERLAFRMKPLENALTGERRMTLHVDVADWEMRLDAVPGVAGVRLWSNPLLSDIYAFEMGRAAQRNPLFAFWYTSRWAMLEGASETSRTLARGRWDHLLGQFAGDDVSGDVGARTAYLQQRAPEFEIDDLRIDVELQKAYGVRRELGSTTEEFESQLRQIQDFMRLGKRTATYWLAILQYDDDRMETASNWFGKRVLAQGQESFWNESARYNLARSLEATGDIDQAIEVLKADATVTAHGNRLRARLIGSERDE